MSWLANHSVVIASPIHFRCLRSVVSPDLVALMSRAMAPKNSAPPNGATRANPALIDVTKPEIAPPIVTKPMKYLSLLQWSVSRGAGRTVVLPEL